jgi:hypothetical protein
MVRRNANVRNFLRPNSVFLHQSLRLDPNAVTELPILHNQYNQRLHPRTFLDFRALRQDFYRMIMQARKKQEFLSTAEAHIPQKFPLRD